MRATAVLAPAVALGLLVAGCTGSVDVDVSGGDAVAGEGVYGNHCIECHGVEGVGTPSGPPLVGPEARDLTGRQVVESVRRGVRTDEWAGSPMPVLPGVSDEELADLVAYLGQLRGEPLASSP